MNKKLLFLALVFILAGALIGVYQHGIFLIAQAHNRQDNSDSGRHSDWSNHNNSNNDDNWSDDSDNNDDGDSNSNSDDDDKIDSAMSAGPESVSEDARILDWPDSGGNMRELRAGTNGWTCLPDMEESPGDDPICADKMSMQWFQAWMDHRAPNLSQPGISYMLQGASDPSNTDPYAMTPAAGEDWMEAPPHIMIFPAGNLNENMYGTDPGSGHPWVMFAGTLYEHLMIPVEE